MLRLPAAATIVVTTQAVLALALLGAWLDPAIHGPVAAAFLIVGTIGALVAGRRSRHPA